MRLKRGVLSAVGFAGSLALCAPASAAFIVDFTEQGWSGAQGLTSFTYQGITLSVGDPSKQRLTFNGGGCEQPASAGLACAGDGIGIDTIGRGTPDDADEVDSFETLRMTFSNAPVTVLDIHFLDLRTLETFVVTANTGASLSFSGQYLFGNGLYVESGFSAPGVTYVEMRGANLFSDASLARTAYAVPAPSVLALLGVGLVGLGASVARRRRL